MLFRVRSCVGGPSACLFVVFVSSGRVWLMFAICAGGGGRV